jgi:hypothetical protein
VRRKMKRRTVTNSVFVGVAVVVVVADVVASFPSSFQSLCTILQEGEEEEKKKPSSHLEGAFEQMKQKL